MENGFGEYKREILYRLDTIEERADEREKDLHHELEKIREDILSLKLKSGLWGMLGGSLPVALGVIYQLVK